MRKSRPGLFARHLLLVCLLVVAINSNAQHSNSLAEVFQAIHSSRIKVVDLTHPLDEKSPYWPEGNTQSPYHASVVATFEHDGYLARNLVMPEHFGTHMDAPAHFERKGLTVDQIPLVKFLNAAIVVDVSEAVKSNPDYRVMVADMESWVKAHGAIPPGCLVFFHTGWSRRWPSQQRTMNQDSQGVLHFPGLSVEPAHYLLVYCPRFN